MKPLLRLLLCGAALFTMVISPATASTKPKRQSETTSFARFERRARAGERLNVVFFGASLTWGANASDPQRTSYRAGMARRFEAAYPRAHFRFFDAAIGGTGSQIGAFRLQRDVLRHHPDLVFLDFSANDDVYSDDAETLASYEALVRRILRDGRCPVVQVIFPFEWNIAAGEMAKMKRRDAHLHIAAHYNTALGDAIALANARVQSGASTRKALWPLDGVHPGDKGYELFAEAAWQGFQKAMKADQVCRVPPRMLHAATYMTTARVPISSLDALPQGWRRGIPNRVSASFDFLMSRWLDDVVIASNRREESGEDGKTTKVPQAVERLRVNFRGSMALLLGESTLQSGAYQIFIDGKLTERRQNEQLVSTFDPGAFAKVINGNGHHVQVIATGLDSSVEHTLEIEPIFAPDSEQELRLESICVAGEGAKVWRETSAVER